MMMTNDEYDEYRRIFFHTQNLQHMQVIRSYLRWSRERKQKKKAQQSTSEKEQSTSKQSQFSVKQTRDGESDS